MPYKVKFADAVKYEGDVILNSLGPNGNVYGALCKNIISSMEDSEVKSYIDSIKDAPIGKIFETKAGKLKCKEVFHIVTPFKNMDDDNNTLLKKAYKDVIDLAVKKGYKSIGLPFIGTGANGYSESEAYDAVVSTCIDFQEEEEKTDSNIIDILVIAYLNPIPLAHRRAQEKVEKEFIRSFNVQSFLARTEPNRVEEEARFTSSYCAIQLPEDFLGDEDGCAVDGSNLDVDDEDLEEDEDGLYEEEGVIREFCKPIYEEASYSVIKRAKEIEDKDKKAYKVVGGVEYSYDEWVEKCQLTHTDPIYMACKVMGEVHTEEFFTIDLKKSDSPYRFVLEYMQSKGISIKELVKAIPDKNQRYYFKTQKSTPKKLDIYKISVCLGMNRTETLELMALYGYCFNPLNDTDMFFVDYLNGEYGVAKTLYELDSFADGRLEKTDSFAGEW